MIKKQKHIEIGGKDYVLTSCRSIIVDLASRNPELIDFSDKTDKEKELSFGKYLADNMDELFYSMIKIEQPYLTKEQSDEIYEQFYYEYDNVDEELIKLFTPNFQGGIPKVKKKINW